jgi:hypothetical protein
MAVRPQEGDSNPPCFLPISQKPAQQINAILQTMRISGLRTGPVQMSVAHETPRATPASMHVLRIRLFWGSKRSRAVSFYVQAEIKNFQNKKFFLDKLYFKDYHPFRSILKEYI